MSKRAPSAPPQIPGFEHLSLVGSGGFSDVFLYQQQRPRRRVAVKVLLNEWSNASQRAAFDAEADLMARLSSHPSIVTIYEADVAPDGRPYLAMEYCSRPSLGTRYRAERLGVAECLRVVVQIAGAVETAHRAGILHRDIKPANILGTDYGHPVLTDFGISSTVDDAARAEGLSIPWSPPESFEEPPRAGVGTDVWALGATLYTFLAGRSPFEVPGGSNSSADLVQRIVAQPLAPTGRTDVPASLENVLATSMAKDPNARYRTILDFARALQQVQIELRLGVTPVDILDDSGVVQHESAEPDDDDAPGTRMRGVVSIDPSGGPRPSAPVPAAPGPGAPGPGAPVPGAPAQPVARHVPPTFVAPVQRPSGPAVPQQVAVVDPSGVGGVHHTQQPVGASGVPRYAPAGAPAPQHGLLTAPPVPLEDTVMRPGTYDPPVESPSAPAAPPPGRGPGRVVAGVIAGVLAVAAVGGTVYALSRPGSPGPTPTHGATADPADPVDSVDPDAPTPPNPFDLVPSVEGLAGSVSEDDPADGHFSWSYPDPMDGDTIGWKIVDPLDDDHPYTQITDLTQDHVSVPLGANGDVCIEVVVIRDGQVSSKPPRACAVQH